MFDIKDDVVIITGSSRGIGKAIAIQMARAGAKVVISSRKEEACQTVANDLKNQGLKAISIPCHVGDKEQLKNLVQKTLDEWGKIDTLICNAATNPTYGPLSELTDNAFEKIIQVNVQSSIWLSNLVVPHMIKNKKGSIILMSSITALLGSEVIGAYGISKAAEAALVRNLATELGPKGIRVNAIAPGLIKTEFSRALWEDPDYLKKQETATPLRRMGLPEEIAGVAHFLSSRASSFMTGQLLVADGGETIL
ncbi:SDR family oxidoreductase [Bacteriovoracales bacterium]|nr:SDR family oxidoreductase [Bacteriovoracales bacterium]